MQVVNLRVTAAGKAGGQRLAESLGERNGGGERVSRSVRRVCFGKEGYVDCPIHSRESLRPGDVVEGPAVIEEYGSATVLYKGDVARVAGLGHLVVDVAARG